MNNKTKELALLFHKSFQEGFAEGYRVSLNDIKNEAWKNQNNEIKWAILNVINGLYEKFTTDLDLECDINIADIMEEIKKLRSN